MSLTRALVFGVNSRFLFAAATVAVSVGYALFAGSSVSGLRSAQSVLQEEVLTENGVYARPGFSAFAVSEAPSGSRALYVHATGSPTFATTRTPWPFGAGEAVPGPLSRVTAADLAALGISLNLSIPQFVDGVPGDWVLIPPSAFDARSPGLSGQATVAVGQGPTFVPAPAVDEFYARGAEQITDGLVFVALTSIFVASTVAAVSTRLEVVARRSDYALLYALGGGRLARNLVVARSFFIVGAGVAVGVAAAVAGIFYVNRAQARLDLSFSPSYALFTIASVLLVGGVAAAWAGVRALRGDLSSKLARRGVAVRRFPGPVPFLFVTPRVSPLVGLALMAIILTVGVILGARSAPSQVLDPAGDASIIAGETGNPLRGSVTRFAAEHAAELGAEGAVSPEIFVPTVIQDEPVMVRGVHMPAWRDYTDADLVRGTWPDRAGQAVIGDRAADRLDVGTGATIWIPGAYRAVLQPFEIVGLFDSDGLDADEVVIGLDDAASLARLDANTVHLVRVETASKETLGRLTGTGIQVTRLTVTPDPPAQGLRATAKVDLLNVHPAAASRTLTLRANGEAVASQTVQLEGFQRGSVEFEFQVPMEDNLTLEVNPKLDTPVVRSTLRVTAPSFATMEDGIDVAVHNLDGHAARDVEIRTPWATVLAANGTAHLAVADIGEFLIEARSADGFGGFQSFGTKEAWLNTSHAEVRKLVIQPTGEFNATHGSFATLVTLTNFGGKEHTRPTQVTWGNASVLATTTLDAFSTDTFTVPGEAPYGGLTVEALGKTASASLSREATAITPVKTINDVLNAKRAVVVDTPETRTQRFMTDVFEALDLAIILMILATILHGGTVIWAGVRREVVERAAVAGTLRSLGATEGQIRLRAARDAFLAATAGIALSLVLLPVAIWIAGLWDLPHAFGHRVPVQLDAELLFRLAVLGLALAVASALLALPHGRREAAVVSPRPLRELAR